MKFVITVLLALMLLIVESVLLKPFNLGAARIDVTVAVVAFLALRAGLVEGAVCAFSIGYLLDLMSGRATGLFTFLSVLVFLLGRLGHSILDVRTGPSFALVAMILDVIHGLLAIFFTWMTSRNVALTLSPGSFVLQVVLTGGAALLLYPLLRRLDPGTERPHVGALR